MLLQMELPFVMNVKSHGEKMSKLQSNQSGTCFDEFNLEWVLEDNQLSNTEFDEYFYDASTQITLRRNE